MKIEMVLVEGVRIGARHRKDVDDIKVNQLADSMRLIGLLQPITVYTPDDASVELVAGRHRLEAARKLDWEDIPAIFAEGDQIDREMIEIAENLHRLDLTKEQRDEHIRRYAELLKLKEEKIPEPQNAALEIGYGKPPPRPKSIARKIADETGLSDDTVRRALNPKPKQPPREPALDKHGDPDMRVIAHRLALKHTVGELQELIDHLTDIIKSRLAA